MATKEFKGTINPEQYLINLLEKLYKQADSYYARISPKGTWVIGTTNDYPLQHGTGAEIHLPKEFVSELLKQDQRNKELLEALQETDRVILAQTNPSNSLLELRNTVLSAISSALGE